MIPIVNAIEKRKESAEIIKTSAKKGMQKGKLNMSSGTDIWQRKCHECQGGKSN